MKNLYIMVINIITFLILIWTVNDYADFTVITTLIILIISLIYLSVVYHKKYIDKKIVISQFLCIIVQIILLNILEKSGIFVISNGAFGLGGGPFGTLIYFALEILFLIILLIINCIKLCIKGIKKCIKGE